MPMTGPALPGLLATIAPYLNQYGYVAVGALLLLEDFGVPVPGEAVMIAASVYAGTGRLNIVVVAVVAFVAAVAGDNIGWLIGRHGGRRLLARFGRYVLLPPHRVARAETFFARHGGKIVPLARFVGVLRQANGLIAGMTGMRFPRFLVLNAMGAALWVGVWTTVGNLAGHHITTLYPAITRFGRYELAALALVVLALLVRMAVRRHRPTESSPTDSADSTDRQESADRKRDHAELHRDLRLPGRVHLDGGRIGLHPGAVRVDHDPGRCAGGRGSGRPPPEPDPGHRGWRGRERGR
jgi:membrane protein DedA with SNARE-associated domain